MRLLQSTLKEQTDLVRHSGARVISAIAGLDLQDAEWVTLSDILLEASKQPHVSHRGVAVYPLRLP